MEKNPFVVLGVPFGASRDVATGAFAKRAKKLRRAPGGATILTDLTWALNEIETLAADPKSALDVYRIPADPLAFEARGTGLLNPPPELLGRRTETSDQTHEEIASVVAAEALRELALAVASLVALPKR